MIETFDWVVIAASLAISLGIGWWATKKNQGTAESFFLAGRSMPWWLLGVSMVATTFAADTPTLITDWVRTEGVSKNWLWWSLVFSGLLTTFVFARRWRRSGVMTDVEFYELRYSGAGGRILRGFRALYLGLFFNVFIIAIVSLAAIKIMGILIGISPMQTIIIGAGATMLYSVAGGLRSVLLVDFFQFALAMIGSVAATYYILNMEQVGGLEGLFANEAVQAKMSLFPSTKETWIALFIIPIALQWWTAYYPGAEPGGGGYIAQRIFAAKDEKHATKASLFFNVAHYALRPWPWILVALASIVVFPTLESISTAFPHLAADKLGHDAAYPAMVAQLPVGLKGVVLASLIAAYISTLSTQVNLASSYLTEDFWKRFFEPHASDRKQVMVGRLTSALVLILGSLVALTLTNAAQMFNIILMIGAGTGLVYLLRWIWWRVNAWSEISATVAAVISAYLFTGKGDISFADPFGWAVAMGPWAYVGPVILTTAVWLIVTFLTAPESQETLANFADKTSPPGKGWDRFRTKDRDPNEPSVGSDLIKVFFGSAAIIAVLLGTGLTLYGDHLQGLILIAIGTVVLVPLFQATTSK
ncbi:MAG: Na+:solute symporter [Akkermansiaceae bacterium]|jgi:solute:Na+ symporter, SSS family